MELKQKSLNRFLKLDLFFIIYCFYKYSDDFMLSTCCVYNLSTELKFKLNRVRNELFSVEKLKMMSDRLSI